MCADVPLPHLDRPFDYLVPAELDQAAQPGVRVKVRFSGQLVDGWLLERVAESDHQGKLAWLEKVVSPEPVLRPEIATLARQIADRYAGSLADVLRLAVPPRQAAVEKEPPTAPSPAHPTPPTPAPAAVPASAPAPTSAADLAPPSSAPAADLAPPSSAPAADLAPPASAPATASGEDLAPPASAPATAFAADSAPTVSVSAAASGADLAAPGAPRGAVEVAAAAAHGAGEVAAVLGAEVRGGGGLGAGDGLVAVPDGAGWGRYQAGAAFLKALGEGRSPRAVWAALPGERWEKRFAEAIAATLHSGRGAVVVVADARDLARLDGALVALIGKGHHVALSAALGPTERYRRFLRASRGQVRAVIGTRAAAFAPAGQIGLVAIWDDGDDVHAEPRAPYPHARQVLLSRAQAAEAAALVGGYSRTAEAQQLLSTGWAKEVAATRETVRLAAPQVQPADDTQLARDPAAASARLPSLAWNAAREALKAGAPVLVQVPRRGYVPAVSCQECRERARCQHCSGPLTLSGSGAMASCRWCARPAADYVCPACGGRRLRAAIVGVRRTAEELGRALPGVTVWTSGGEKVLDHIPPGPALVLATPGAEPVVEQGYGAVLLLDAWALLTRADLRAGEETARRWFAAAALAKPAAQGGKVVVVADGSLAPVQALIRWDAGWLAQRELAERRSLGFPPVAQLASLTGSAAAVAEMLEEAGMPEGAEVLGPLPVGQDQERMLVRVRRSAGPALARALHEASGVRSARKAADMVRVQLDPQEL
ncbi:primosomal protein N' [Rhizocola hellebori]|uniref:primosomal protein N' n=1 Tax=Rhizocola hellebori TaxID=1392758 RepID=UPI003570CCCA